LEAAGTRLGKYELLDKVGEGGMARVYRAMQIGAMGFRKEVAVKLILSHVAKDERRISSLINEARVGGLLRHRNVVEIYEFDQAGDRYYLAMEYVHGYTLTRLLQRIPARGLLPPRIVAEIALQACAGLAFAHTAGDERGRPLNLVHRDLKPANVMVGRDGVVKVMDFGIAKAETNLEQTADGMTRGSPAYMSPEQVRGDKLDHRSDLFSLGACITQLITGDVVFSGTELYHVMRKIDRANVAGPLAQVEVRVPGMVPILRRAMQRDRTARYASAADLAQDIEALLPELEPAPPLGQWVQEWMEGAGDQVDPRSLPNLAVPDEPESRSDIHATAATATADPAPSRRRPAWLAALLGGTGVVLVLGVVVALVIGALVLRWVAGGPRFDDAAVAGEVACGVLEDGSVRCRGESSYGIHQPPEGTFVQVEMSLKHACGRGVDGGVRCWGEPFDGDPTPVEPLREVAVGMDHACGLRGDGTVVCWGSNHERQCFPPKLAFTAITAGRDHNCGLAVDDRSVCWGDDGAGRTKAPEGAFVQLDAGRDHTCGIRPDGSVVCWGADGDGQIAAPEGTFEQVSAGTGFSCAVAEDGSLACWGRDDRGQATPPSRGHYRAVTAGTVSACAITARGRLRCWGGDP
jgi:eukaryotic-like serine/threonine-protein kinase